LEEVEVRVLGRGGTRVGVDTTNEEESKNERVREVGMVRRGRRGEGSQEGEGEPSRGGRETSYWERMRPWLEKQRLFLLGMCMADCSCKDSDGVLEGVCEVI
jgi:hypothetical protein